jgi:uncharacterized membrane protein YfcA
VDWRLLPRIAVPGVIGGILGAYALTSVDASVAKPLVMAYLAAVGLYLLLRAWQGAVEPRSPRIIEPLGLAGGFLDAAGGGGWGPIVTSNLLIQGAEPRRTIGTVSTAEFFITSTISATFLATLGWDAFTVAMLGLLIGGLLAAPLGGVLAKRVPARPLMAGVGVLLTATSVYTIWQSLA